MPHRRTKWRELTRTQQRVVLAGAAVQVALQGATLWDLHRRSADELRGSKGWWTLAAFVNVLGPIAYFAVGRRAPAPHSEPGTFAPGQPAAPAAGWGEPGGGTSRPC